MSRAFASLVLLFATRMLAADKENPRAVTLTFYIAGVECGACSELIHQSVQKVPSVSDYAPYEFGIVNISFDERAVTAQQIAQAVGEAFPAHGKPYEATLHFRVPDYATGDNARRVDAVFAKHSDRVKIEMLDQAKGEFAIHFVPAQPNAARSTPQDWNPSLLDHAIRDPAPKGLGLDFQFVRIGQEK